jgi:hypothetical protein
MANGTPGELSFSIDFTRESGLCWVDPIVVDSGVFDFACFLGQDQ